MTDELQPYCEFAPTPFDRAGAFLDDRQDWLVLPVGRTRDTADPLTLSNFEVAERELDEIDPDGNDHELHSFNHWGPGWFEILIVRPDTPCHARAIEMADALADYPVLDESDYSQREYDMICETWDNMSTSDRIDELARAGGSIFAARRDSPWNIDTDLGDWPYILIQS